MVVEQVRWLGGGVGGEGGGGVLLLRNEKETTLQRSFVVLGRCWQAGFAYA